MVAYERPVEATLHVHLANGEAWEATDKDWERFGLVQKHQAYMRFEKAWEKAIRDAGLVKGDITNAKTNPLRYLVESAIFYPDLMDHSSHEGWGDVVEIERVLKQNMEES
jgi:hypothetical protein